MSIKSYFEKRKEAKRLHEPMDEVTRYLLMGFASIFLAFGTHLFKYPNSFVIGGVEGLSIVLSPFLPYTRPQLTLFINIALLIVSLIVLGKKFTIRTGYVSIINSVTALILSYIMPMDGPFTDNKLLELILMLLNTSIGAAILFNLHASSGGTDIIALILKKYTNLEVGKALLVADSLIVIASLFIFEPEIGLLSLLGLIVKGYLIDGVIQAMNTDKLFIIITSKPKEIGDFIRVDLHRSATVLDGVGNFEGAPKSVFLLVLSSKEAPKFKKFIKEIDPYSFVTILNTSKIIGKGFYQTVDDRDL